MSPKRPAQPFAAALASALVFAIGVGCASGPPAPTYTADQVTVAEQEGNLEALFDQISADIEAQKGGSKAVAILEARRNEVGEKLASDVNRQVDEILGQAPRYEGLVPVIDLEKARTTAAPAEKWSASTYEAIEAEIDAASAATNRAISERKAAMDLSDSEQIVERLQLLDELVRLYGSGHPMAEQYGNERDLVVTGINAEVEAAVAIENWDSARDMLEVVQQVKPGDAETTDQLVTVNTKAFERDFWKALEKGQPDKAHALLVEIAATDVFPGVQSRLASSKDAMADYYESLGSAATQSGSLAEAYRRFMQAREIRALLGEEDPGPVDEEKPFIAAMQSAYERANEADQMGLAWGSLKVIGHMSPTTPQLRRQLRETREVVLQRAIKRLSAAPFEDQTDGVTEYGEAVGSKVVQYLFETIPNDIRIIEREQLSDILREKKLSGDGDQGQQLAAADYLVQGTILEAKVDSTEKRGKKTMRVVTEQEERTNPDYNLWVNMSSKERKGKPKPPATITVPRKEDVTVEVTVHRKIGLFSASYRVIDADSAKVLFADSVRARVEHEDTSSEGVELGDFKMEFKMASLPSDIEILDQLADEIAIKIGTKLSEVLKDPEAGYMDDGERLVREGNFEDATRSYAYAIVLNERKDADVTALQDAMRLTAAEAASR